MIKAFMQLHHFQAAFDEAAQALEQAIGRSACMAGCGLCCERNTVIWSTLEALNAVSVLAGSGKLSRATSLAEGWLLERDKKAVSYEGMLTDRFLPPHIREEMAAIATSQCPFLMENKDCLIWEVRPIACRAYGVTRVGNPLCNRPPGKGETQTQFMCINAPEMRSEFRKWQQALEKRNPTWTVRGLAPTLLFRAAEEKKFRRYVADNRIATAKIVGSQLDTSLIWQPQLDALNSGVAPDLAIAAA